MKDYRQLLKELPSNTIVCAFGEFDPPTVGHELLVKTVKRLAEQKGSDHVIYSSASKILQEQKKYQYLNLMFPKTNFKSISESFVSTVKELQSKYKTIIVVAGTDQMATVKRSLKESVQYIAINEKNPDSNDTKMKSLATKALYEEFKKKLPTSIRELDSRRLMNDVRHGMGLETVKEQLNLVKDDLREQYFRGEIFNEGDIVESNGQQYTIVKRGSNHLLLKEDSDKLVSKWIQDVQLIENHTMVAHNKDHKELSHGADFSMKVGTEHHKKINDLKHGECHEFKCMDGHEWTVGRLGDNLRFTGHKLDTNIASNIAFHVPANYFSGEEEPETEDTKQIKSFSQMLMDKASKEPEKVTPQERVLINMIGQTGFGHTEINEGVVQDGGTDQIVPSGPDKVESKDQNGNPTPRSKGTKKGFLTFYGYTKDNTDFKVAKMESYISEEADKHEIIARELIHRHGKKEKFTKKHIDDMIRHTAGLGVINHAIVFQHLDHLCNGTRMPDTPLNPPDNFGASGQNSVAVQQEEVQISELSTDLLARYKKAAGASAKASDEAGNYKKGDKRFKGINKATNKQFDNDLNKHGQFKEENSHYDEAEEHLSKANDAEAKGDMKSFHAHMANHHDSMSEWHDSKGRSASADKHAEKAEYHHEKSLTVKEDLEEAKKKNVCSECGEPTCEHRPGIGTESSMNKDPFFEQEELTETEINKIVEMATDADIEELYEEEELTLVYEDTGEEVEPAEEEKEIELMEMLSRGERFKAKIRFRRTKAKRDRSTKIALKRYSNVQTINKRARRLAIKLMKARLLRGRNYQSVSIGDKERIDQTIAKRKGAINRIATKLVTRIRKVEKSRMSHGKFTKGDVPTVF